MSALLAVYRDRGIAEAVARQLETAHVATRDDMRLDAPADYVMPPPPTETVRGALTFLTLAGSVGLVLGAVLGLAFYDGPIWEQLLVGAVIGGAFGGALGAIVGGGFTSPEPDFHNPDHLRVAQPGVTLRVEDAGIAAEQVMTRFNPIRIDRIDDGALS